MALPTSTDLKTLDFSYMGSPFCQVPTEGSINLSTLDYSYLGSPFIGPAGTIPSTSNIKSVIGVALTNIKSILGVPIANIKSAGGVNNV